MLKIIPDFAIKYALDGVIKASALGQAASAQRLQDVARARARAMVEQAESEALRLRRAALAEGYREGYADALAAFLPQVQATRRQETALVEAALARIRQTLRATLHDLGFEEALIARWSALQAPGCPAPLILHLPPQREALAERLRQRPELDAVDIRIGHALNCAVLVAGDQVFEFNPEQPLLEQVADLMADPELAPELQRMSAEFAAALLARMRRREQQQRLSTLGEPSHEHFA